MYQRCREAFLVNSDLTLRAQLTEFRDHKLIKSKKGLDGVENLLIPLDPATLQEFVNQQEADGLWWNKYKLIVINVFSLKIFSSRLNASKHVIV